MFSCCARCDSGGGNICSSCRCRWPRILRSVNYGEWWRGLFWWHQLFYVLQKWGLDFHLLQHPCHAFATTFFSWLIFCFKVCTGNSAFCAVACILPVRGKRDCQLARSRGDVDWSGLLTEPDDRQRQSRFWEAPTFDLQRQGSLVGHCSCSNCWPMMMLVSPRSDVSRYNIIVHQVKGMAGHDQGVTGALPLIFKEIYLINLMRFIYTPRNPLYTLCFLHTALQTEFYIQFVALSQLSISESELIIMIS